MAVKTQRLPEPEELFVDYVKRMARHRDGRACIIVHMSKLDPIHRTRQHIELVTTRLGQVARDFDGRVFPFGNNDIALVVRDVPPGELEGVLFDVRYSFSEDPLVAAEDAGEAVFIEHFDVQWSYDEVEKLAKDRVAKFFAALNNTGGKVDGSGVLPAPGPQTSFKRLGQAFGASNLKQAGALKPASLVDLDRRSPMKSTSPPRRSVPGSIDPWLANNAVAVGGTYLSLGAFVGKVSIYDMSRRNEVPAAISLRVDRLRLYEAYSAGVGMKMNQRLEGFLLGEVERGLLPLLRSLTTPVRSSLSSFRLSLQLSTDTLLSPTFLLTARRWQEEGAKGCVFWFDVEDLIDGSANVSYVADFLHDLDHLIGVRGVLPGELARVEMMLSRIDFLALRWPEGGLGSAAEPELADLELAKERYGAARVFLQHIDTAEKVATARAFGFQFAEGETRATEKLLTSS